MTTVDEFKSCITRVRDILRGPGMSITGMDSMRHICIYLLAKFITVDMTKKLEIPEELGWENILNLFNNVDGGVQKALDLFFHPETDNCLLKYFDKLFGTQKFLFEIKNAEKHKEIMTIINKIKF